MARSRLSKIGQVIFLIAVMFCVGWATGKRPAMGSWEYEIVELPAPHSHAKVMLDQRGEFGWELVSVMPVQNTNTVYYYMKRAK